LIVGKNVQHKEL